MKWCLTGRSSGRQQGPWLRHFHGPCWYPPLAALLPAPLTLGVRRFGSLMNSRLHLPSSLTAAVAASATGAGTFCTSRRPRRLAEHHGGQVPARATHSFLFRSGVLRRAGLNMGCCRSYPPSNTALRTSPSSTIFHDRPPGRFSFPASLLLFPDACTHATDRTDRLPLSNRP